jgi:hypothetical protein
MEWDEAQAFFLILKRAESVFRENPDIKQMVYYLCLTPFLAKFDWRIDVSG